MVSLIKGKNKFREENGKTDSIMFRILLMLNSNMGIYCNTNQLPELSFSNSHSKLHGARGLSKYYHLRFDPKLDIGVCAIRRNHVLVLCMYIPTPAVAPLLLQLSLHCCSCCPLDCSWSSPQEAESG